MSSFLLEHVVFLVKHMVFLVKHVVFLPGWEDIAKMCHATDNPATWMYEEVAIGHRMPVPSFVGRRWGHAEYFPSIAKPITSDCFACKVANGASCGRNTAGRGSPELQAGRHPQELWHLNCKAHPHRCHRMIHHKLISLAWARGS